MQLSKKEQALVGVDYDVFGAHEVSEIASGQYQDAIGRATGFNVDHVKSKNPAICGNHLVKLSECELGGVSSIAMIIGIGYDWDQMRIYVNANGHKIQMDLMPSSMTFPAIEAQANALERLIQGVKARAPITRMDWTYTYDDNALSRRGIETIREMLNTAPRDADDRARTEAFEPGRTLSTTVDCIPWQSLSVAISKDIK